MKPQDRTRLTQDYDLEIENKKIINIFLDADDRRLLRFYNKELYKPEVRRRVFDNLRK